jgi:hypothetical protein
LGFPFTEIKQERSLKITIPKEERDAHVTVVKLTLESPVTGVQFGAALKGDAEQAVPGTMIFHPADAKIDGTATVQGEGADATIVNWTDKGTKVSWPLELDSPGHYAVELLVSATEIDSLVVMTFGPGKHLHSVLPVTGSVDRFQRVKVGEVTFPNAERAELVIKAVGHRAWKPVQVKEVRLVPRN